MQSTITKDSTVVASSEQVSSSLSGAVVILGLHNGVYYSLEGVGCEIWSLILESRTIAEIRDAILQEYQVDPEQCDEDLFAFLRELEDGQLIEFR